MVQCLNLCTVLVLIRMPEFYSVRFLFFVVYNYFSSRCHKQLNVAVRIRKIHRDESDFICINNE
ncbi:hypothetical protein FHU10_2627 [Serratia fonticola]|uniref:Uncharacterized protein n=1 Tax=Serratia fonticola TaxID=47917 RepID=A0A559T650_SERFO|nr:hypothetical protein FHU09_5081 [Serratia fonticola]TQI95585.1 hypothetical protein FHU11_0968 [Serratia fonticola]TVZ70081.1 hypothetical protein FHU10_2627 [Serratia fonticola]